jgi:bifunctional non-homologous end joining protein LigD
LASNIGKAPSGPGWVHEIKFDGYRSQLHIRGSEVTIYTKNGHDWTERYRSVAEDAKLLDVTDAVIDGEMVVLREDETCDMWALLRDTRNGVSDRLTFFAFDLLFLNGEDLRKLPLLERKQRLSALVERATTKCIRYSAHFEYSKEGGIDGPTLWAHAHNVNVEGIISKRAQSPYRSQRGEDWIKTPCEYRETLPVVGMGFDGERLGGLYLARKVGAKLVYAGQLEEGLSDEVRARFVATLSPFITKRQPVETFTPKTDAKWLEPICKARIVHRGGMNAVPVRRAAFEGLITPKARARPPSPSPLSLRENIMRELVDAVVPSQTQLCAHWRKYGKLALPHLANRPLTLVRHVDGVTFFHKGPLPRVPESVHQLEITKADGSRGVRLFIDSVQGLLGLVQMGVVEVHPWAATVDDIERPDTLIFDLDPGEGIGWDFVLEAAFAICKLLAEEGLDCWPKLTGGSGLHLMSPVERRMNHKQVHEYALMLAKRVAATNPRHYTTLAGASNRVGKLFIDHLRNGRGFTAVGCYSPRARPGLPIAMPITWSALEAKEKPNFLTLLAPGKAAPKNRKKPI